jgi:rare lipoprotein A
VRQPYVVPRHRLVFAVWLTVLALPILVIDNIPKTEARAASVKVDATRASETTSTSAPTTTVVVTTTAAGDEVANSAETTPTTAPKPKPKTVATTVPSTTTTAPVNTETGGASWYDYRPGECAHVSIPKGTVVTVRNLDTGATTSCVVTDRGPYQAGRIIDLDRATFAQIADPSQGVVQVEISW